MSYKNGNKIPDFTRENLDRPPKDRRDFYHDADEQPEEPVVAPPPPEESPTGFKCNVCGFECKTERGMQTHVGKAHKVEQL